MSDQRMTGIESVGEAPWGTHFCQFYQTRQDLVEILVPYFVAGLRSHEFCMWVTCEPLDPRQAKEALAERLPDVDRFLEAGQLEIVPHTEWYLRGGSIDLQRVLDRWVEKLDLALSRGLEGMRVTGNTAWLEQANWRSFADYEAAINNVIGRHRMIALCTYSLEKCGASEIMDVMKNHEFALVRRGDQWELIESRERRATVEALRRSEARHRSLFDHSLNGLALHQIVTDGEGQPVDYVFLDVNRAFEELTGLTAAQVVGRRVTEVLPDIERSFISVYGRVALTGESMEVDQYAGSLGRHYEISAFSPAPGQFAASFVDVTARKRAEQALREQAEQLAEANRLKDEFLATLSHELRTPLNSILGWAQLLSTGVLDSKTTEKAIGAIARNAHAQTKLINDILDVSRIITGKLRLDLQTVGLDRVIAAAIDSIRPAADAKKIRLASSLRARPVLVGDPDRLQQIFWNLLANAVKFTPAGGEVRVEVDQPGSKIVVRVADTGSGIAPEFLPYVFERFSQLDTSTRRVHGGLGLGLAIVRHLTELHGGTVKADSPGEGRGATFTVTLPVRAVQARPSEAPSARLGARPALEPTSLAGIRVLVVDDEPDARELLAAVLGGAGAQVSTAASTREALAVIERERPDVLVSDIGMPEQDGYDLIEKVRALPADRGGTLPAAALTAYGRGEDRARAIAAGYHLHVPKPVMPEELIAVVATLGRAAAGS